MTLINFANNVKIASLFVVIKIPYLILFVLLKYLDLMWPLRILSKCLQARR